MNVISNSSYHRWKTKKSSVYKKEKISSETNIGTIHLDGFVNLNGVLLVFVFAVGFLYLYSMNGSAVQGYEIKKIENEINELREESDNLKIREAELNSLYRLEEEKGNSDMEEVDDIVYVHDSNSMALK
ncbi:MAG: hypothetical protein OEV93_01090 [Candidatus Moranbacteria bacterium]|nr:hypothetical protein [Candidatus Moranbacteria bacterium]